MTRYDDIKHWGRLLGACLMLGATLTILQNNGVVVSWWEPLLLGIGLGFLL